MFSYGDGRVIFLCTFIMFRFYCWLWMCWEACTFLDMLVTGQRQSSFYLWVTGDSSGIPILQASLFSFIKDYRRNYTTNMSSSLPLIVKYWYSQMIYVDTNKNILYEFWYKNFIFFVFGNPFKVSFWKKVNVVSNLNCVVLFQINAILPLTPLFLPILWRMVNYYGQARVYAAFKVAKETKVTIVKFSKRYTL